MVDCYRKGDLPSHRAGITKNQVKVYRQRCQLMSAASNNGLASAMLLILTLICGELEVIFPAMPLFDLIGAAAALIGLALVIVSTFIVVIEGMMSRGHGSESMNQSDE